MKITRENKKDITILELDGRLDADTSVLLDEELANLLENGTSKIIIDLKGVNYVSSAGLRIFFSYLKKTEELNGKICYSSLNDWVENLFDTVGFLSVFNIFKTKDEAIEHLT
ncbi:STAS domain-containing protein [candidate division KSB1 bacterium]|nr:STAS domain-containing protein [candidate division KSB1 bacterium]